MAKYTYKNIIIDPNKEGIENLIGKEVYAGDIPGYCLEYANEGDSYHLYTLIEIRKYDTCPFLVKHDGQNKVCSCLIEKKEEPKPKYVPFESKEEFIEAFHYHDNANYSETEDILMNYGMWLKDKNSHEIFLVTGVFNQSIHICDFDSDESWGELLNEFTFLDGSPCGKLAEEEQ